ncbi:hypothetical protein Ae201684P_006921 [Aphanomyces euteiches]|uniref:RNI-like superfamily protein n=1 Tax=Aphanomyces euteiches TaxID=100861 RepID=A0A6G0WV48_9STRA|nr:hypothetical protein Ae201684_011301 [Aphanomyces euteiches]KAH9100727.1 hypothetical protein Ae201684P_006921 [Aphanomyces euteiches]KAH9138303.1 hypothetical protein AeRB84_017370 [Aphanomyces euteiches]
MDPGCNIDYVSSYIHFFHQLIEKRVKTLTLCSIESVGFETAWAILKPILENSKVEELKIEDCDLSMARMNQVIDAIRNVSTLRSLFIGNDVCREGLNGAYPWSTRVHEKNSVAAGHKFPQQTVESLARNGRGTINSTHLQLQTHASEESFAVDGS